MTVQHYKVLFTGPVGAGKTTAIRSISDGLPMMTDVRATDETRDRKPQTTVAMDYGVIRLGRSEVVHLYGTPGQERFDFMWEILGEGMLGYVLLVDADRPETLGEAAGILAAFRRMAHVPFVVALNRSAEVDPRAEDRVREALELTPGTPVVPCDATDKDSVKGVLLALLYSVLDDIEATAAHA